MKITVETVTTAGLSSVWNAWNTPQDIVQWNTASPDWHTTRSTVDLRPGGAFTSRMEAKDGTAGFDFDGTYTSVVPQRTIQYLIADGREVDVQFVTDDAAVPGVRVTVTFDAEHENPPEFQRQGWQAILDNFGRYVAAG